MKKLLLGFTLIVAGFTGNAQGSAEFGFSTGFSSYLGDLQPKDYTLENPGAVMGFHAKSNLTPNLAIKAFVNLTRLSGDDATTNEQSLINRNLSFRTNLLEYGAVFEVSMLPFDGFNPNNTRGKRYFKFTPYAFGGVNIFHFNPKTYYNGTWVDLQPLNTEGQDSKLTNIDAYRLTQVAIPFGIGFKYQPSNRIVISYEMGLRKTFTDYLDDVSGNYVNEAQLAQEKGGLSAALSFRGDELQGFDTSTRPVAGQMRGQSANKDWYTINTFSIAFKLYKANAKFKY